MYQALSGKNSISFEYSFHFGMFWLELQKYLFIFWFIEISLLHKEEAFLRLGKFTNHCFKYRKILSGYSNGISESAQPLHMRRVWSQSWSFDKTILSPKHPFEGIFFWKLKYFLFLYERSYSRIDFILGKIFHGKNLIQTRLILKFKLKWNLCWKISRWKMSWLFPSKDSGDFIIMLK